MKIDDSINPKYTKITLSNGVKCILYPRKEIHSVTIHVNVNVGLLDETEEINGLSHFVEHVVHEGTTDLPTWQDVEEFKTKYSASTNAYTSSDHTQYYATFPFQYAEKAIYYASQVVLHPIFSEEEVNKQRDIIIDELKSYEDETDFRVIQNVKQNRFSDNSSPFAWDVIGNVETLKKLNAEALKSFWQEKYTPENIEVYFVGNFDVKEAKAWLEKHFVNSIESPTLGFKPERQFKKKYPKYSEFKISAKRKLDLDKYYLTFTFPSLDFKSTELKKRYKINFLQAMTASSSYMNSILWKKLRQELGIVYGVYCWSYDMFVRDILGISTSFEKEHLETVLKEFYEGINRIKNGEISEEVFEAKKRKTLDTQLMSLDRPEQAIQWISSYEDELEEHGKGLELAEYLHFVDELEFSELIEVANEVYDWEKLNIGVVSRDEKGKVETAVNSIWKGILHN